MSLTFTLDYTLLHTNVHNSFVQQFLDIFHDLNLMMRCTFNGYHSSEVCIFLFVEPDLGKVILFLIILCSYLLLPFIFNAQLNNIVRWMIMILLIEWLIARYYDGQYIYYKIDILTVHLIIWQFLYPMYKWVNYELQWPIFFLQQISCCICNCLNAYIYHELLLRYFPFKYKMIFLWILSFYDILTCLYHRGRLYKKLNNWILQSKTPMSYAFYSYDPNDYIENYDRYERQEFINEKHLNKQQIDSETNFHNHDGLIGFGDFIVFNLMILFVLQSHWSLMVKILVFFGCVLSVYIGEYGTFFVQRLWSLRHVPALPCPTIVFSIYCIFLNVNSC